MIRYLRTVAFFLAILFFEAATTADTAPTPAEVRLLLHANGVDNIAGTLTPILVQQLIVNFHQQYPKLPQRADVVIGEVTSLYIRNQAEHDQISEKLIPIYSKYFSKADVKELTVSYASPIGKKLVSVTPAIQIESAVVGRDWAQAFFPGLQAQLQSKLRQETLIP
jgi:hypothetical protein